MVCECSEVDEAEIKEAVRRGAKTIDDVGRMTGACRTCGSCAPKIVPLILGQYANG